MSKRSNACDISPKVRQIVYERDKGCCVFCGSPNNIQQAHLIARSGGGLGIPENLVLACWHCHFKLDQSTNSKHMKMRQRTYLQELYPGFTDEMRRYKK